MKILEVFIKNVVVSLIKFCLIPVVWVLKATRGSSVCGRGRTECSLLSTTFEIPDKTMLKEILKSSTTGLEVLNVRDTVRNIRCNSAR